MLLQSESGVCAFELLCHVASPTVYLPVYTGWSLPHISGSTGWKLIQDGLTESDLLHVVFDLLASYLRLMVAAFTERERNRMSRNV
jgi:hypothetical protein